MSLVNILSTDIVKDSRAVINDNFTYVDGRITTEVAALDADIASLETDKAEDSVVVKLSGDQTIAGVKTFSSSPIVPTPTTDFQAATKKYADDLAFAGVSDASETVRGIVEEATDAEVTAGTATGSTGAKLFVTPTKLLTYLGTILPTKAKVRAYKSDSNSGGSTSYVQVTFGTENYDVGNNFASNTFTAPRTGYYAITAQVHGASTSSSTGRSISIAIYKNGSLYSQNSSDKPGASEAAGCSISDVLALAATDTITIYTRNNGGANEFTHNTGESNTFITVVEL